MPEGLTEAGQRAYVLIIEHLQQHRAFYSPYEWQARGEKYGTAAHLIVVYDGSDKGRQEKLRAADLYFEECTGWSSEYGLCSAVYSIQ